MNNRRRMWKPLSPVKRQVPSRGPPVRHSLLMWTRPVTSRATAATRTGCVRYGVGHKTPFSGRGSRNAAEDPRPNILQLNTEGPHFQHITCKINTDFSCCDIYEKIKSNRDFLKKVLSTEKNDWIGRMCQLKMAWISFCLLTKCIILVFLGVLTTGITK